MRSNKGQLIKNKIEYWNCKSVCFCRNWSSYLFGFNNVTFGIPRRFVNLFNFLLFKGLSKLYCMYHKILFYFYLIISNLQNSWSQFVCLIFLLIDIFLFFPFFFCICKVGIKITVKNVFVQKEGGGFKKIQILNKWIKGAFSSKYACTYFMTPSPENGRNFFGEALGSKTTREPIRIDFCPFGGPQGAIFQNPLNLTFFKFWTFQRHYFSSHWT